MCEDVKALARAAQRLRDETVALKHRRIHLSMKAQTPHSRGSPRASPQHLDVWSWSCRSTSRGKRQVSGQVPSTVRPEPRTIWSIVREDVFSDMVNEMETELDDTHHTKSNNVHDFVKLK